MFNLKIKTKEEILHEGIEFTGDVCFSGEYGEEVYEKEMEDGGQPITGLLYEKDQDGNILYYSYYVEGVKDGDSIWFYKSGKVKEMSVMKARTKYGESISMYENGDIKRVEQCEYGIVLAYKEYDTNGDLINEKNEPTDMEKKILEKFRNVYENRIINERKNIC